MLGRENRTGTVTTIGGVSIRSLHFRGLREKLKSSRQCWVQFADICSRWALCPCRAAGKLGIKATGHAGRTRYLPLVNDYFHSTEIQADSAFAAGTLVMARA